MPILDTRGKACGLMGRFVADLVVQIMAYLVDIERKKNREAQREGIEAKKARGEWENYGRPRKVTVEQFDKYYKKVKNRQMTVEEAQKKLGISYSTYKRYVKEMETRS